MRNLSVQMGCSFFTDKDNIGLLCCTNLMIGIISGIGLMFLCTKRHKAENYESAQMSLVINEEYTRFSTENRLQRHHLPRSSRLLERNRQRNIRCPEPVYVNKRDDYLDPEFHKRDSNYLKPIHCNDDNSDLDREQKGYYMNTCTDNRQGSQNSLDDYLEPRNKFSK